MSKNVANLSFAPTPESQESAARVRLHGSVSFDIDVDVEGAPEEWGVAVQSALASAAKNWIANAVKDAVSSAMPSAEEPAAPAEAADPASTVTKEHQVLIGNPPRNREEATREFPAVQPFELSEVTEAETVRKPVDELKTSREINQPSVVVAHHIEFPESPGLDEDSDGMFFSDVPVTDNVSTEHSHAAIRVKNVGEVETRDYTPTERPREITPTTPGGARALIEQSTDWFSNDVIDDIVEDAGSSNFEESESSDALLAALPSLNQRIGKAPSGRVPRPSVSRPMKFSERAPTGTALARLQKRLRKQRTDD